MNESGREPLGPFALYFLRPTWISGDPGPTHMTEVAWEGMGLRDVPIKALRDGCIIFEFDKATEYAGGEVPAYTLPENRRIPSNVTKAEADRTKLVVKQL